MTVVRTMVASLALMLAAGGAQAAPQPLHEIQFDRVEWRELYGGLGGSGTLGSVTEFFVREIGAPAFMLPGEYDTRFPDKKVFLFKDGEKVNACPTKEPSRQCVVCDECAQKLPELAKLDVKAIGAIRKQLIYSFPATGRTESPENLNAQNKTSRGGWVNFFQSAPAGTAQPSITARYETLMPMGQAGNRFGTTIFIFKSADDPAYYLCPAKEYDLSCLKCTDCEAKLAELAHYAAK